MAECKRKCSNCLWFVVLDDVYHPTEKDVDEMIECIKGHSDIVSFGDSSCEDFVKDCVDVVKTVDLNSNIECIDYVKME